MTRKHSLYHLFALAALLVIPALHPASAVETSAPQAIVIDYDTGAVLFEKNADEKVGPASMAKMMTAHLLFERLKDGRLSLEDTMAVSETVWKKWVKSEGSKMFVQVGTKVKVEDLIRGIVVQSGNDASDVVAETLAGTEEAFAREMNRRAQEMGMSNTRFQNASGWPAPDQYTTVRDLATLAVGTIRDFPDFYHYYAEKTYKYNNIDQGNRNPLLYKDIGADGLKTGHTEESGYGLAGSAIRDGRRIVVVVHGTKSMRERGEQAELLLEWAFREWAQYALYDAGETVGSVPVWLGNKETVPVVIRDKLAVSILRKARRDMTVKIVHQKAVPAPISKGDQVAKLVIAAPGVTPIEVPLYAGADIRERGFFGRIGPAIMYLVRAGAS